MIRMECNIEDLSTSGNHLMWTWGYIEDLFCCCFVVVVTQPENIMLSDKNAEHPEIKIIDFGLAHRFVPGEEYKSLCGTPQYLGER